MCAGLAAAGGLLFSLAAAAGALRSISKTVLLLGDTRERQCTYLADDAVVGQQLRAVEQPLVFDPHAELSQDELLDVENLRLLSSPVPERRSASR